MFIKEGVDLKMYLKDTDCLYYDAKSPSGLRWGSGRRLAKGSVAGSLKGNRGYYFVSLCNKKFAAHLIVWLLQGNDYVPKGYVLDHKNKKRSDNRVENLRCVPTNVQNMNITKRSDNTSGTTGVSYDSVKNEWVAQWVTVDGRRVAKRFSVEIYGSKKAKKMAFDARILGMQCNPLYSLNHGKSKPGRKP